MNSRKQARMSTLSVEPSPGPNQFVKLEPFEMPRGTFIPGEVIDLTLSDDDD